MDYELAAALAGFGMVHPSVFSKARFSSKFYLQLARGNAFLNLLSIGGESPLIPPLPGNIDKQVPGGIAKHGRFEGNYFHGSS